MNFITLLLLALALSMDCFAVAIGTGCSGKDTRMSRFILTAAIFGLAHFIMPLAGWFIGDVFQSHIEKYDHWIAFVLLLIIGVKMIREAFKKDDCKTFSLERPALVLLLAIATSIDALIVGMSLALFGFHLLVSAAIISLTAFVVSVVGFYIGKRFGCWSGNKAELFGGIILILIAVKVLIEHL